MKKLKKWLKANTENFLTAAMFIPSVAAILLVFYQFFTFTFTGEYVFVGEQLGIGTATSLAWGFGGYKTWEYFKIMKHAE